MLRWDSRRERRVGKICDEERGLSAGEKLGSGIRGTNKDSSCDEQQGAGDPDVWQRHLEDTPNEICDD